MGSSEAHTGSIVVRNVSRAARDLHQGPIPIPFPLIIQKTVKEGACALDLIEAKEGVDFGKLGGEIGGVTLREAPSDNKLLSGLGTMESTAVCLEDCTDALLLGGINEAARINQNHIGIVGLGGELIAVEFGIAEHDLGIDEIFGAAKADKADLAGFGGGGMGHRTGKAES